LPLRFAQVDTQRVRFEKDLTAKNMQTAQWSTHEWLQFLRKLSHPLPLEKMEELDLVFHLTDSKNSEIADEWYRLAIASNYEKAYPQMEIFLGTVGRKKFLEPLYMEMKKTDKGKMMAAQIFDKSKRNYHPLTAQKIESILNGK
jgi:leukotriene-A4 hydrolase